MGAKTRGEPDRLQPETSGPASTGEHPVSPALVSRDDELARLMAAVSAPPVVAVVEGEAGVGKTRLVEELLASPELSGCRWLTGRCRQIREPFPLGAVIEAVRGLGPELGELALGPVAGALRPLVPELAQWAPPAVGASTPVCEVRVSPCSPAEQRHKVRPGPRAGNRDQGDVRRRPDRTRGSTGRPGTCRPG
jgi:hypothetical protein